MNSAIWIMAAALLVYCIFEGIVSIIKATRTAGSGPQALVQRVEDLEKDVDSLEAELDQSRKRIEVLEKIVTDEKYNLQKEFEDLASN